MGGRERRLGPERGSDTGPSRGRVVPAEPAPSLLGRLWDWLTVEVPDESATDQAVRDEPAPGEPAPRHRRRSSEAADAFGRTLPVPAGDLFDVAQASVDAQEASLDATQPSLGAAQPSPDAAQPSPDAAQPSPDAGHASHDAAQPSPDAGQPSPDAGHASVNAEQTSLDTEVPRITRRDRRGTPPTAERIPRPVASRERNGAPARRWETSRRRTAAALALVVLCAAAVLAVRLGHPGPRPAIATPHPVAPAPAPPSPQRPAAAATGAAVPSAADCASMQMQPVVPPASVGHAVVGGLCYTLASSKGWLVGCAPGFQAACDPSLQAVIDCLRQAGAQQHGVIDERNVLACDVPVGSGSGAGSAGGAAQRPRAAP